MSNGIQTKDLLAALKAHKAEKGKFAHPFAKFPTETKKVGGKQYDLPIEGSIIGGKLLEKTPEKAHVHKGITFKASGLFLFECDGKKQYFRLTEKSHPVAYKKAMNVPLGGYVTFEVTEVVPLGKGRFAYYIDANDISNSLKKAHGKGKK